jgi:hypothetical protein
MKENCEQVVFLMKGLRNEFEDKGRLFNRSAEDETKYL